MNETVATPVPVDLLPADQVPQEPGYDVEAHGYDDDWARNQLLQLRPTELDGATHPDERPCPLWCVAARHPDHEHEVETLRPGTALHTLDGPLTSRASLYRGKRDSAAAPVSTSVFVSDIKQRGQGAPVISVALRTWDKTGKLDEARLWRYGLEMTIEDATELVTVLTYLLRLTRD